MSAWLRAPRLRGRALTAPAGDATRPTGARVKEALFSILGDVSGVRVLDQFWIGPEISASRDDFSQQYRIGAHLTGFKLAVFEWSAAAGYVTDSFHRSGIYGRIGVLTRQ